MTATRKDEETLVKDALTRDSSDRFFQSAFDKMTRSIPVSRVGRKSWIFYQARHGSYRPWRAITEPMELAMEAGASEEDCMAFVHCLAGLVQSHFAKKEVAALSVKEPLRLAIHTDSAEEKAIADALCDESPTNLERVIEATAADTRQNESVISICRRKLAEHGLRGAGVTRVWT